MANPNGNPQNLIPQSEITPEKRREISRKGAEATNRKLKKKRDIKAKYEIALEILAKSQKKKIKDKSLLNILDETDPLVLEKLRILFSANSRHETKLKAINDIEDRLYGKPIQHVEEKSEKDITIKWED